MSKRSKVNVIWLISAETEIVLPTNFKLIGRRLEHALSTAMASYKSMLSLVIARERGHTMSSAPDGHTTWWFYLFLCLFGK